MYTSGTTLIEVYLWGYLFEWIVPMSHYDYILIPSWYLEEYWTDLLVATGSVSLFQLPFLWFSLGIIVIHSRLNYIKTIHTYWLPSVQISLRIPKISIWLALNLQLISQLAHLQWYTKLRFCIYLIPTMCEHHILWSDDLNTS